MRAESRASQKGLTLLELLVVLAILAALALVVAPRVLKYVGKAKTETAAVQIENVASALELYFLEIGAYPVSDIGLRALVEKPTGVNGWDGPYLKKASGIVDPWGRPFKYRYPGEHGEFDVFTLGADDAAGGAGNDRDLGNWDIEL
jgi:general secretion pathway protein G